MCIHVPMGDKGQCCSGVPQKPTPCFFFVPGSLIGLGIAELTRLAGPWSPERHLCLSSQHWHYKHVPHTQPFTWVLGVKVRPSCWQDKHFIKEPPPQRMNKEFLYQFLLSLSPNFNFCLQVTYLFHVLIVQSFWWLQVGLCSFNLFSFRPQDAQVILENKEREHGNWTHRLKGLLVSW